jgi:hypothetical protein
MISASGLSDIDNRLKCRRADHSVVEIKILPLSAIVNAAHCWPNFWLYTVNQAVYEAQIFDCSCKTHACALHNHSYCQYILMVFIADWSGLGLNLNVDSRRSPLAKKASIPLANFKFRYIGFTMTPLFYSNDNAQLCVVCIFELYYKHFINNSFILPRLLSHPSQVIYSISSKRPFVTFQKENEIEFVNIVACREHFYLLGNGTGYTG